MSQHAQHIFINGYLSIKHDKEGFDCLWGVLSLREKSISNQSKLQLLFIYMCFIIHITLTHARNACVSVFMFMSSLQDDVICPVVDHQGLQFSCRQGRL